MSESESQPTYLTTIAAARRLGVGADRVRQLAREGRLEPVLILPGGQRLFSPESVEQLAERRQHGDDAV